MLQFMVLGAPRSGTAWAANWLSVPGQVCLHDPMWEHHFRDLDALPIAGVSCTGLAYFLGWVNAHPARKVVLHRPIAEVNASLRAIGLPPCPGSLLANLESVAGLHVVWTDLFRHPEPIYRHLLGEGFDAARHSLLKGFEVTAKWREKRQDPHVIERIRAESR